MLDALRASVVNKAQFPSQDVDTMVGGGDKTSVQMRTSQDRVSEMWDG